jgi:cell wall-associated NlpC family hydrolase
MLTLGFSVLGPGATATAAAQDGSPTPANTAAGANSVTDLQTQAQELAGEIAADGRTLDELASSYQAAQIHYTQLLARQAGIRTEMAQASAAVASARHALKEQALLAYLAGGAPVINYLPDRPGRDPSLTVSYAEIIAGGQKTAVETYRAALETESRQQAALDATTHQAAVTLSVIRTDATQATATLAAQRKALAQVNGQLAVEVARVQAAQQAAEQAQEKQLLAARGDLPADASNTSNTSTSNTANSSNPTRPATNPTASSTTGPSAIAGTPTRPTATSTSSTTSPPSTGSAQSSTGQSQTGPSGPGPAQAPGANKVLAYARAQLGKPYQWGGAGPDSFDCSGLVMMAWEQAGIYFPHLAQDQYDLTSRIPLSALIPGDLVFFGTPDNVYHVGIYIGNGNMIDAPETGQNVQIQSIYWDSLLGAGRVTTSS